MSGWRPAPSRAQSRLGRPIGGPQPDPPAAGGVPIRRRAFRRVALATLSLGAVALLVDVGRPPAEQQSARALVGAIHLYQRRLSPHLPTRCRFEPSCSRYAAAAIGNRGTIPGVLHSAWRILRCAPWTPRGTVDPPPAADPGSGTSPSTVADLALTVSAAVGVEAR